MKLKIENATEVQTKIEHETKYGQKAVKISFMCGCKYVCVDACF